METRASYLLIGVFVLVFVGALFVFVFWLARSDIERETERYHIYFKQSVTGLKYGADVTYRGFKFGSVTNIRVDPEDPSQVEVEVEVDSASPVRQGDVAALQIQGITGVAFIDISGAEPGNPLLEVEEGRELAVIPSGPSQFAKLLSGAPALIENANILVGRVSELVKEENRAMVDQMLTDIGTLIGSLASRSDQIVAVIDTFDESREDISVLFVSLGESSQKLNDVLDHLDQTLGGADKIAQEDVPEVLDNVKSATENLDALLAEMRAMVDENREPLLAFTEEGLGEIMRFMQDARLLTTAISRVLDRLEADGARFLLGSEDSGFTTPK